MKLILTGASGFIGGAVLRRCLRVRQITSLILLTRRDIPLTQFGASSRSKIKVVILEDFNNYSEKVLSELEGADGCIWAIGTYSGDAKVEIEYPNTFFKAVTLTSISKTLPFRYIYLGGAFTETDQAKTLWFLPDARRVRGRAQTEVLSFGRRSEAKGMWESLVVRPGGVLGDAVWGKGLLQWVFGDTLAIGADELAAAMIDLAVGGSDGNGNVDGGVGGFKEGVLVENGQIVRRGREVLRKQA